MKQRRIHAEHLLGRTVRDVDGRRSGRIEEVEIENSSDGCLVTGYVLGAQGLLKRFSFRGIGSLFIPALVDKAQKRAKAVPWEKMDLTNPKRPRLRCRKDEL
jgi:sporulation protein YlmC with PRC-barrel domain